MATSFVHSLVHMVFPNPTQHAWDWSTFMEFVIKCTGKLVSGEAYKCHNVLICAFVSSCENVQNDLILNADGSLSE